MLTLPAVRPWSWVVTMHGAEKQIPQEFPTTWWSLIGQALAEATTIRSAALVELINRYRPPLRAHLMLRKRFDEESADELLQGFITEKILERYLLEHADREKGKFRSLLVRSLENYAVDWIRERRAGAATGLADVLDAVHLDPNTAVDAFDVAWARHLLEEVLTAMKVDCEANQQAQIWGVFETRLLAPVYERSEPIAYEEVCRRFHLASPEHASNVLVTAKRKFQRAFERIASRYQHDGETAGDVLQELISILSRAGPLDWQNLSSVDAEDGSSRLFANSHPARVAHLLELAPQTDALWRPDDLAGLMRHQLAQSLGDLDLRLSPHTVEAIRVQQKLAPLQTLADMFQHPAPPVGLLEAVKKFGRKRVHRPETNLPEEIASALYFGSIAAALVRHDARISTSDDELLRWGITRLLDGSWIEAPLRGLFESLLARLSAA